MASRLDLHEDLVNILGTRNVYFQPPETIKMIYPCIVYNLAGDRKTYADDTTYSKLKQYTIMVIDKNPDSIIPDAVGAFFRYVSFDRFYTADNLNHYVYTIFY